MAACLVQGLLMVLVQVLEQESILWRRQIIRAIENTQGKTRQVHNHFVTPIYSTFPYFLLINMYLHSAEPQTLDKWCHPDSSTDPLPYTVPHCILLKPRFAVALALYCLSAWHAFFNDKRETAILIWSQSIKYTSTLPSTMTRFIFTDSALLEFTQWALPALYNIHPCQCMPSLFCHRTQQSFNESLRQAPKMLKQLPEKNERIGCRNQHFVMGI